MWSLAGTKRALLMNKSLFSEKHTFCYWEDENYWEINELEWIFLTRSKTEKSTCHYSKTYSKENMLEFICSVLYKLQSFPPKELSVLITNPQPNKTDISHLQDLATWNLWTIWSLQTWTWVTNRIASHHVICCGFKLCSPIYFKGVHNCWNLDVSEEL